MTAKRSVTLITGIIGQDGSYLAELLLEKRYDVHAIVRRKSSFNRTRLEGRRDEDMSVSSRINKMLTNVRPPEVYNLAAQSHVGQATTSPPLGKCT